MPTLIAPIKNVLARYAASESLTELLLARLPIQWAALCDHQQTFSHLRSGVYAFYLEN